MKFVIFDIDGTLANTKKVEDKCFVKAFSQTFGIDICHRQWEHFKQVTDWGITEEIIQREWNRPPRKEEYELMISNFVANLHSERTKNSSQFSEVPGAKDFFYTLKRTEGFELGIATGAWKKSAELKLEAIRITLEDICFSNSDDHKSREAITQAVIDQLIQKTQDLPEQIVYFGDGEWDYITCQNLGIKFIGIDIENDGKLSRLGAKTVFRDYTNGARIMHEL